MLGAPLAAEAIGNFAIDGGVAQSALGAVVGGGDVAGGDEHEELVADLADHLVELASGGMGRVERHQSIELAVERDLVGFEGGVGEVVTASADAAGVLEQDLDAGRQDRVAAVDCILNIADQMREADLVGARGPPHLAGIAIRYPVIGAKVAEEGLDHRLGSLLFGNEDRAVAVMEHPEPMIGFAHPQAGLVGGEHGSGLELLLDQIGLDRKGVTARGEDVDQRTLADLQPDHVEQDLAQPRQRNALHGPQIDHQRAQVRPERRSWLQPWRRRRLEATGAARTDPAVQRHAGYVG